MIWQKQRVRNNEQWRVHNKTITVQYANNHYNLQQLIQKIQNDCTNTDSTNSVHHKMSTHNGIVLEPTIEECSCATTHDARNAMFEPISECSVFTWSVAQTTADGTASAKVNKVNGDGKRQRSRRFSAAVASACFLLLSSHVGQHLLQRWPASASGRHPWRAHGLTQRSTIEWGSPGCWLDYCSRFCWAALMTSNMSLNSQLSQILS